MKKILFAMLVFMCPLICTSCGEVGSLQELRSEATVYKMIVINRPISEVRTHLINEVMPTMRIPQSIEEATNGEKITIVSNIGYVRNYFLDIEKIGDKTKLTAYQFGNGAWWILDEMINKLISM